MTGWSKAEANDRTATWSLQGGRNSPTAVRTHFRTPGFDFKVRDGFRLRLSSLGQPFITVADATYQGVSSAPSRWALVTFREPQPSILLGFLDGTASLRVTGAPGAWELRFSAAYSGWVRAVLPFGSQPVPGQGPLVGRLGQAARICDEHLLAWSRSAPRTTAYRVRRAAGELVCEWQFDRPGAVVPPGLILASEIGACTISTPYRLLTRALPTGPLGLTTSPILRASFPTRPLAQGQYLVQGPQARVSSLFSSTTDPVLLAQLPADVALLYERLPRGLAPGGRTDFYLARTPEEWVALADTALRHSQALAARGESSGFNLALTSALWARDPAALDLAAPQEVQQKIILASLLSSDISRQAEGAQMAAALAAKPALAGLQKSFGFREAPSPSLLPELTYLAGQQSAALGFLAPTTSPIQVEGSVPCWVRRTPDGWVLSWNTQARARQRFVLRSRLTLRGVPVQNAVDFSQQISRFETVLESTGDHLGLSEILLRPEGGEVLVFP